jgi:hypothetical protein
MKNIIITLLFWVSSYSQVKTDMKEGIMKVQDLPAVVIKSEMTFVYLLIKVRTLDSFIAYDLGIMKVMKHT